MVVMVVFGGVDAGGANKLLLLPLRILGAGPLTAISTRPSSSSLSAADTLSPTIWMCAEENWKSILGTE